MPPQRSCPGFQPRGEAGVASTLADFGSNSARLDAISCPGHEPGILVSQQREPLGEGADAELTTAPTWGESGPWTRVDGIVTDEEAQGTAGVHVNDDYIGPLGPGDAFGAKYEGPDADRYHFLQFVWAELSGLQHGARYPITGVPVAGFVSSTTPSGADETVLDGGNPWKDQNLTVEQPPGMRAFTDTPAFKTEAVDTAIRQGYSDVVLTEHYEVFLVRIERGRTYSVAGHTTVTMRWDPVSTLGTLNAPVEISTSGAGAEKSLPSPFRAALEDAGHPDIAKRL